MSFLVRLPGTPKPNQKHHLELRSHWFVNGRIRVFLSPDPDRRKNTDLSGSGKLVKSMNSLPSAAPGDVHVLPLLVPLDPHADPILEEGGDQAEAR